MSIITLSRSKYTICQCIVFSVLLQNYSDEDHKNYRNVLVINNVWYNICYTCALDVFCIRLNFFISFLSKISLDLLLNIMKNSVRYFGGRMMEIAHIFAN